VNTHQGISRIRGRDRIAASGLFKGGELAGVTFDSAAYAGTRGSWGDTRKRCVAMMNGYGGWGMGAWLMMGVITPVVLAVIVVGVVALSRPSIPAAPAPAAAPAAGGSASALRTLDERFARGEVDEADNITEGTSCTASQRRSRPRVGRRHGVVFGGSGLYPRAAVASAGGMSGTSWRRAALRAPRMSVPRSRRS